MGRPPCCDKSNVKRGLWTPEEDAKILAYVSTNGIGNWTMVPKKAGLNRCGKSCRLRWTNYLRPDLKHDGFTPQEEELIISLHQAIGSRWSLIAKQLPGRTDNDVKNHWNTKLRKKLSKLGIDPLTHKPFSLVLSDYGNISGLQNTETQINVSPNKNKNCTFMPKPEPPSIPTGFTNTEAPIRRPVVEQVQTGFSNEIIASWDSPSQFQLISQEPIFQPLFNETTSSCSSTASSNLVQLSSPPAYSCQPSQAQIPLSSSFNWGEFILSDPLTYPSFQQQQDIHFQRVLSPSEPPTSLQTPSLSFTNGNGPNGHVGGLGTLDFGSTLGVQTKTRSEATSSVSSFVEAILEQDSEMRAEFPDILDESFDY